MKIAVIGAGISGIGAAWLLSKDHEIHLFECENRLGGHAHTVNIQESSDSSIPMDTGFLVYNELTYHHLKNFFKVLDVETMDSDMSLSIQVKSKQLEWNGSNLNTVFAQRRNILNWRFHSMLLEILRFGREAEDNLSLSRRHAWTLAELLNEKKYSLAFKTDYLLPIGAAIWSTPEAKILDFPAATFLTFFINHKLLQVNNRPIWRTVKNGSIEYVKKATKTIQHIHQGTPVVSVERSHGKVYVATASERMEFDTVVMATHAPITAKILKFQNDKEKEIISSFCYEPNKAILHSDESCMPQTKLAWAAWNVLGTNNLSNQKQKVSLSYYLNRLQHLSSKNNYFVTLNSESKILNPLQKFSYSHPQFDQKAIRAQRELPQLQGAGGVYFAGAWTRYGFHEDGLLSAVNVAQLLGATIPWATT